VKNVTRKHLRGLAGALALLVGGAVALAGASRRSADVELLILSTTSNRGEVDPCG
jgi:hypothetical protein